MSQDSYYTTFEEDKAFSYAKSFCRETLAGDFARHSESRKFVAEVEQKIFLPALELQVAGLCLIVGKPRNEIHLPVSFAFFIVDHLAFGWAAMLASNFRVAYSLSRSAVEASIFEVASTIDNFTFSNLWNKSAGTGGKILRELRGRIPNDTHSMFSRAWDMTKALGHASYMPVMSSGQIVQDQDGKKIGIMTFGGPNIEPLNVLAIEDLSLTYGTAAIVGLEAMKSSLLSYLHHHQKWEKKYIKLMNELEKIAKNALSKLHKGI